MSAARSSVCRVVVAVLLAVALLAAAGPPAEFSFEGLNRSYAGFIEELAPIELGPARVLLTSPEHSLTIVSHQVTLQAAPAGGYEARLVLRFFGHGTIDADVSLGGVNSQVTDQLVVPEQEIEVRGRVDIEVVSDGYEIRTLDLQSTVVVRIESRLASRLFSVCRPMTLVLVSLDCDLLEQSLTYLEVPMPEAGGSYFLPAAELTPEDRSLFSSYLQSSQKSP